MSRFVNPSISKPSSSVQGKAVTTALAPAPAPAQASSSPERRELLIGLTSDTHTPGYVEIASDTTLKQVRKIIENEFDEDMFPAEFFFALDGVRISRKQEERRQVWAFAASSERLRIQLKDRKPVAPNPTLSTKKRAAEEKASLRPSKTIKIQHPENQDQGSEETHSSDSSHGPSPSASVETETDTRLHMVGMEDAPCEETHPDAPCEEPQQDQVMSESNTPAPVSPTVCNTNDDRTTDPVSPQNSRATRKVLHDEKCVTPILLADESAASNDYESLHSYQTTTDFFQESMLGTECENADVDKMSPSVAKSATNREDLVPECEMDGPRNDAAIVVSGSDLTEQETESSSGSKEETDGQEDSSKGKPKEAKKKTAGDEVVIISDNETHRLHNRALKQSRSVLHDIEAMLENNPLFCSEDRRADWLSEIRTTVQESAPQTVIGVLGNTGVGKSSLLNALLEEASVLPTSGSRGCTAAVVELKYNADLGKPLAEDSTAMIEVEDQGHTEDVYVYKGVVEFIQLQEWLSELKVLLEECSTNENKKIYAQPPESVRQPDVAAAWSKINQVYGQGTMERYRGKCMTYVYGILSSDRRIVDLLTPDPTTNQSYKSIRVQEGRISRGEVEKLVSQTTRRSRRERKKWAASFRAAINQYVYRKGNGNAPQTWPLIRKVILQGPWPVLSTGACLVDLPGVRDANAARAKVSERYLQNCCQIWVVAPIKRAVDDGTAKELLGEQFKRRLLMDGQYGNVAFICTQTDDCETTEIMRDHQDVAMRQEGRWEKMADLQDELGRIEKEFSDLVQEQEDLQQTVEECKKSFLRAEEEAREAMEEFKGDEEEDNADLEQVRKVEEEAKTRVQAAKRRLQDWKESNDAQIRDLQDRIRVPQRQLKSICATVRNEYSKAALQEDFRAGLKELYQREDEDGRQENLENSVPEDLDMDVFCISANDYLKVAGIKPSSDGPSNTFSSVADTQIPLLREFVHSTTARYRKVFVEQFVNSVSDMVDRVKLLARNPSSKIPGGGRVARKYQTILEYEAIKLETSVKTVAFAFRDQANKAIKSSLHPSLKLGARKGQASAMKTVDSWGSNSRRSKYERAPNKNGLYWATYQATIRRDGVYNSSSAGAIDMNQELCDPMEKEFGATWQQTMDSSFRNFLADSERKIFAICFELDKALVASLAEGGLDQTRLGTIANTATRTCTTAVKASFGAMRTFATDTQRNLNRSLLPSVQSRMKAGYASTLDAPRGTGVFNRMKIAMHDHSSAVVKSMFDESATELIDSIDKMVESIVTMILSVAKTVSNHLNAVYSVCWEGHCDKQVNDPALREKIRVCRDKLLPSLNQLRKEQNDTMGLLGLRTENLELDVTAVASLDNRLEESFQKAQEAGEVIDLSNDDDSENSSFPLIPCATKASCCEIKADPDAGWLEC